MQYTAAKLYIGRDFQRGMLLQTGVLLLAFCTLDKYTATHYATLVYIAN